MEQYLKTCILNPLFNGIGEAQLAPLLECLHAEKREYKKGSVLFHTGENVACLGIVLSGIIHTESTDILGNRSIISCMKPGQLFCDAYSSTRDKLLLVDIVAQTNCEALLIKTERLIHVCSEGQHDYARLNENLIHVLAQKYVDLGCKVIHLSGRTTRGKLLSYLSEQFRFSNGQPFSIPFTQQELADYLFVDRSGMSTEFNRLIKEGILISGDGRYSLSAPERDELI